MARPTRVPFESRLREFRLAAALTQEQLAELIGVTPEMVRRHERGDSLPIPHYRERYARLFKVSEAALFVREAPLPSPSAPEVRNRNLILDAPVSLDEVFAARAEIPKIVALDNRFGAADIVKVAVRLFKSLQNRPHDLRTDSKELYATLAELAEVAGWLAYDAELHPLARRMNQEAVHYARMCGNRSIELLALQNMSMHASVLGHPSESLALVGAVLEQELSPRVRALFLTREARVLAQLGDKSSLGKFAQIRSLFLDGLTDSDLQHFWWVDEREMAWHEAMATSDLGEVGRGIDFFERSVEATPVSEVRSQYLHRAYLLRAQVDQKAWPEAEATAASLQPLAVEVASTRTDKLIQQLASRPDGAPDRIVDSIANLVSLTEQKLIEGTLV